jgi:hypothetical protein
LFPAGVLDGSAGAGAGMEENEQTAAAAEEEQRRQQQQQRRQEEEDRRKRERNEMQSFLRRIERLRGGQRPASMAMIGAPAPSVDALVRDVENFVSAVHAGALPHLERERWRQRLMQAIDAVYQRSAADRLLQLQLERLHRLVNNEVQ